MKKHQIRIGETVADKQPAYLDLHKLVETRMLVEASSGSGKSMLMRLIAERAAGQVQTIILDHEDEFPTLRQVLDVLLVGDGRDVPIDVRSAAMLARRLAELRISAVINLYDLELAERREYVGAFLGSLLTAPKTLWHPMLIMLDEAHIYCPEKGDAPSRAAVVNLMSQGRKREYCEIVATQRFAKIDKDAIADAKNIFIGGTFLDVDQRRAGDMLGLKSSEYANLRDLAPGEWFAFGQALLTEARGIVHFRADLPQTKKPESGKAHFVVPKASEVVSSLVEQLGDLPAQAQAEQDALTAAEKEIARLTYELRARPTRVQTAPPVVKTVEIEKPVLNGQGTALLESTRELVTFGAQQMELGKQLVEQGQGLISAAREVASVIQRFENRPAPRVTLTGGPLLEPVRRSAPLETLVKAQPTESDGGLTAPQQRILDALALFRSLGIDRPDKSNVAVFADASPASSAYANNLGRLRVSGLVDYPAGGKLALTTEGIARANPPKQIATLDELHRAWFAKLSGPKVRILQSLIQAYPDELNKEDCAYQSSASANSSAFANNLGNLRTLGLIDYPRAGFLVATDLLFPEGLR